jgi:methionine-rich copper-binding protein CopC
MLLFFIPLFWILFCLFPAGAWADAPPSVVSMAPVDGSFNVLINTTITIQFDMTMNTGSSSINLQDEHGQDVAGTIQWRTTTNPNDTLVFILQNALKPATGYYYEGNGQSATGGTWFSANFITKFSTADATPPTVQTVYPYDGMTNVSTGQNIAIQFSEAMNPPSIITPGNISLTGPGISGTSDYSVTYDIGSGDIKIRKNAPFSASSTYTVTISTNVRDIRGNPLKTAYSWSFTTGAADTTHPTVLQTIPRSTYDVYVSPYAQIHIIFSKEMDETTINPTNIILENESNVPVPIEVRRTDKDLAVIGPAGYSPIPIWHTYTVTLGTGIKDRAGNGLEQSYSWYFSVVGQTDYEPVIDWGTSSDDQIGKKFSDGINTITKVSLGLGASDDVTSVLTVKATDETQSPKNWTFTQSPTDLYRYSYSSTGNENLNSGYHTLRFDITDGATSPNTVTFWRNIFIFAASPTLSSPASGATGVSTTPTFTWSYSGLDRPMYYNVAVFDGPDMNTSPMVWLGYMVDKGSGDHSITIPADKPLSPNKTYYWGVKGANYLENGETYAGLWPFTTGGTLPPPAHFEWAFVRSEDIYPSALQGNLLAKVFGPSPADILELKVTGPGGFQYIFTEDDIQRSEQQGQYYTRMFPNPLMNGTYNFSVTDSAGRTVTATKDFTSTSLPKVDFNTMIPVDNTYVNTTTPTLSWDSVGPGYYYRVNIWDWNGNQQPVYASDYIQDTSIIIPSGYLLATTSYNWRVDVFDTPILGSNRSRSNALQFSTGASSYIPANMIEWVNFHNDNAHYSGPGKSISTNVLGPLPDEVIEFNVSGPGLDYDFQQTNIMYNLAWPNGGSMYSIWQAGAPAGGSYTFTLETPLGNDSYVKTLTPSTIPIVDQASMSPANNVYLTNLTPTFSWAAVAGGPWYYRVHIQDWRNRYVIYTSARSTDLFATIPAGVLKSNMSYKWRVEVFDGSGGGANNRSTSGWNCFTTPRSWLINFNVDERTDIAVYRVSTGAWFVNPSNGESPYGVGFGGDPSDYPVAGDYDGDGKNDYAVYRHNTGAWWIYPSSTGVSGIYGVGFGGDVTDVPVPFDYDGDGKSDLAIYRISTGAWFIYPSSIGPGGIYGVGFGGDPSDIPVPGDYDGDGKADIAIYRKSTGAWFIYPSSTGPSGIYGVGFGGDSSDIPVPGDYDGDGKTDLAIYRASIGAWFIYPSSTGPSGIYGVGFGGDASDIPAPGDYDGDGKTDLAIYRAGTGSWFIYPSRGGSPWGVIFGGDASDLPVVSNPAAYM